MKNALIAAAVAVLVSAPAFATGGGGGGDNAAYGGAGGTGVGIGGNASAGAVSGSKSSSRSSSSAGAFNDTDVSSRNSLSTKQLNEQQLSSSNTADNGGSSNDNSTNINPGGVISYTYVPNTVPQGVITNDAAITSGSVHVLDPLFGLSWQDLKTLPDGASKWIAIGNVALGAKPDGTAFAPEEKPHEYTVAMRTAHAALCAHDPEMAAELAAAADTFAPCQ